MRALIALGALGLLLATAWIWLGDNGLVERRLHELADPSRINDGAALLLALKVALFALSTPTLLMGLFVLLKAWQLFGAYGRHVFGEAAIRPARRIAWALVAAAFLRPLADTLSVLVLTWHNPPGRRQLVLSVSWEDYLCLLFGGLLIAMAWAMTEASRIEQDNAGFV